nr:MAG TPA: hypothetical protein [Caudoviricetes sp.]
MAPRGRILNAVSPAEKSCACILLTFILSYLFLLRGDIANTVQRPLLIAALCSVCNASSLSDPCGFSSKNRIISEILNENREIASTGHLLVKAILGKQPVVGQTSVLHDELHLKARVLRNADNNLAVSTGLIGRTLSHLCDSDKAVSGISTRDVRSECSNDILGAVSMYSLSHSAFLLSVIHSAFDFGALDCTSQPSLPLDSDQSAILTGGFADFGDGRNCDGVRRNLLIVDDFGRGNATNLDTFIKSGAQSAFHQRDSFFGIGNLAVLEKQVDSVLLNLGFQPVTEANGVDPFAACHFSAHDDIHTANLREVGHIGGFEGFCFTVRQILTIDGRKRFICPDLRAGVVGQEACNHCDIGVILIGGRMNRAASAHGLGNGVVGETGGLENAHLAVRLHPCGNLLEVVIIVDSNRAQCIPAGCCLCTLQSVGNGLELSRGLLPDSNINLLRAGRLAERYNCGVVHGVVGGKASIFQLVRASVTGDIRCGVTGRVLGLRAENQQTVIAAVNRG